jgi:WD40 repeat protein
VNRRNLVLLAAALLGSSLSEAQEPPKHLGEASADWNQIINSLSCSPDGKSVVLARNSGFTELWSLETGERIRTLLDPAKEPKDQFSDQARMKTVLFLPGTSRIAGVGYRFGLRIWDTTTGAVVQKHEDPNGALAVTADGALLSTVDGYDGKILLWDLVKGAPVASTIKHKQGINDLAFSPDGKALYSCSSDLTLRKWDLATGKELWRVGEETGDRSIGPTFPQHLRLSPDGRILAVSFHGCWQIGVQTFDVDTGKKLMEIPIAHSDAIAFMHGRNVLAVQSKQECLMLYDVDSRRSMTRTLGKDKTRRFALAFTPDNRFLITPSDDGRIQIWDVSTFGPAHD